MTVHARKTDRPRWQLRGKGAAARYTNRCLASPLSERPRKRGGVAQGLVRRRVKAPSDDAAESGTALVSSMMELIALTKSSPDAAGAGRTAVRLRVLKPKRASAGKEESRGSPRTAFLGPYLLVGFWHLFPFEPATQREQGLLATVAVQQLQSDFEII
jgi:hypothetical protein